MDKIRVLQLGTEDWNNRYVIPKEAEWIYTRHFKETDGNPYDAVFIGRQPMEDEYEPLRQVTKAYTLFLTENVEFTDRLRELCGCCYGKIIPEEQMQKFLSQELRFYFPASYGEKYNLKNLELAQSFRGTVWWDGNYAVNLEGDFGSEMKQIAFWRNNIPVRKNQMIDLWLEYQKDANVEIELEITQLQSGSLSKVINHWRFDETQLKQVVHIEGNHGDGPIFASISAKGEGKLRIIALHDRYSRGSHGHFLPGGVRYVTSKREEIFAYFDPGDRKPPLNVYFSGYKTMEGFEGYNMMRKMGCPFLLISEARLEGGSFYLGSAEYEKLLADILKKYMEKLNFSSEQVILSGLSMGSTAAVYYGCDIRPHAIILGKPLASIGNVSANEQYLRPGGFPTSLDVLQREGGGMDDDAVRRLNERFWDKFDSCDWGRTKFIIAYMLEDDYDTDAYDMFLTHLQSDGAQIYGKGIHGRHNDNTQEIVRWFVNQYHMVLENDFNKKSNYSEPLRIR